MEILLPLFLPVFFAGGLLYLALIIADAMVDLVEDWLGL
jgi:hypothetical protein